jgi:hypothetical protein
VVQVILDVIGAECCHARLGIGGVVGNGQGIGVSLRVRKRIEEIFGWAKTVAGLRKTCFIGLAKVKAQTTFTLAAYNLTRMATIFGWRLNTV